MGLRSRLQKILNPPAPETSLGAQKVALTPSASQTAPVLTQVATPVADTETPRRDARAPINQHSVQDVANYYNAWTGRYVEGFGEVFQGSRPASTAELLDYILDAARIQDGMKILDAGCGVCGPSLYFAEHRKVKIEALTISEVQVAEAQKRIDAKGFQDRLTVRQGDFHRLAEIYPARSFDRVLFLETLCHAEDYRRVIEQAKKVLKPGGCLYIKDFYYVDYRSRPDLIEPQTADLKELNEIYCLVMPDVPSTVNLLSEQGFSILYMREPTYDYEPAIWEHFMRNSNTFWLPKMGSPDKVIGTMEYFARLEPWACELG